MAKPPASVRSIRLPDTVWAALIEEAERRKASVNSLIGRALLNETSRWSDEEVAAMKARPRKALEINKIEPARPAPKFVSRLKGEWKAP